MSQENTAKKMVYEKATAEIVYFDNSDVITTSGEETTGCQTWSNQNGAVCYYGLTN